MNIFLILPVHMYDKKYLIKDYRYIIYEHPHYFTSYNYNKKKLMLHRSSMKYYETYLKDNGYKVTYIEYHQQLPDYKYHLFDPIDEIFLPKNATIYESPNFLLTNELCERYKSKTDKFFFTPFYYTVKEWLNILPKIKSTDKENRHKLKQSDIDNLPIITYSSNTYVKESVKYINKHFSNNIGNTDNFMYPITHSDVKKWLMKFIKERFYNFGKFQDAITQENNTIYHSLISASMNIGLINPIDVIKEVIKVKNVPMNSKEGFVRQIFWREYQRYCYTYIDFSSYKRKYNTKALSEKWYSGTLGILPVDNCIKRGIDTGYLHHIERLMIIGNYMNLSLIKPKDGHRWFMEFSCDSYEWVMAQNVYDMVFHITNGLTMRRPYISSSNYILKMSDFRSDKWCQKWNKLYNDYIDKYNVKHYRKANLV